MTSSMKGRVAVITGGAGMIGHAAATSLARAGADVLLVDINAEALAARRGAIESLGVRVETQRADVRSAGDVAAYVAFALQKFGRIDAFFNNAGIEGKLGPTHEYEEAEFDKIIAVNLKGIFLGLRHVLPVMLRQGQGAVVNTGSIASERGLAGACAYNASKHAVIGLTRTAASEVGARGVRVNAVMPGVIDTPLLEAMLRMMFNGDVDAGKRVLGKVATQDRIGLRRRQARHRPPRQRRQHVRGPCSLASTMGFGQDRLRAGPVAAIAAAAAGRVPLLVAKMIAQLRTKRPLNQRLLQLLEKPVRTCEVVRLLIVSKQLIQ
jgi:NAD(P)-dependent dehydrogenase (short-subunit alcohol dehydrogenase family)